MHRIKPNIFHLNISGETIKDPERSNDFFVDHTAVFVVFVFDSKIYITGCLNIKGG